MGKYEYGAIVEDVITGYTGKVTAFCYFYGNAPSQYLIEGIDSTGRPVDQWVNADRVELVKDE